MRDFHWFLVALGVVTLALYGCDRGLGPDVAARAGDFQLDIEEIAQILAPVSELRMTWGWPRLRWSSGSTIRF